MNMRVAAAVVLLFANSSVASGGETHPYCGTSAETIAAIRTMRNYGKLVAARAGKSSPETTLRTSGDLIIIEPEESMVPFDRRADIENSSLVFRREGGSGYRVQKTSLNFENEIGTLTRSFDASAGNEYIPHSLRNFSFPFGSGTVRDLYVSPRFGIFLAPPGTSEIPQVAALDAMTISGGVIAPYLSPNRPRTLRYAQRDVYVRESSEQLIVTWRSRYPAGWDYDQLNDARTDVQAVLERNGDIRFNYRQMDNLEWGAVLVTTGQEASRSQTSLVAGTSDAVADSNGSVTYRDLLDIRRLDLQRVNGSELLKVRVTVGGRIDPEVVRTTFNLLVRFEAGSASVPLTLSISPGRFRYCTPAGACSSDGGNVEFTSDGVVLNVLDRLIPLSGPVTVRAITSVFGGTVDTASVSAQLTSGATVESDLSTLEAEREIAMPILEAFTLPVLNPDAVWARVRDELDLWDAEVDGLAIFQNFPTDIMQYATAYSTVGNSGADGVWAENEGFYGSNVERSPALLHMNRIIATNDDQDASEFRHFLLGHEFGHRWLYGFTILENGQTSWMLNPGFGHPAQYVHTPAAFNVKTNRDYSVMGGSNFNDRGDGSFDTPPQNGAWSYSWHELYLMGLASRQEVPSWFYIADSEPQLGPAYHPPVGLNVRGRRVGVHLDQLTSSLGERFPAAADSQKEFRLLVVMLQDESSTTADEERILAESVRTFPAYFSAATGGRGTVITSLPVQPTAAFSAPERGGIGSAVAFRDQSTGFPASWRWDFGDGTSSTQQFPQHVYRAAGTYRVTLTVQNSRGSNTTEESIVIEQVDRRRPLRR